MADLVRFVTFDVGGHAQLVADLNDFDSFTFVKDTFAFEPPAKQQVQASIDRRYGGSRQRGELHENAAYAVSILVRGATPDQITQRMTTLLAALERVPVGDLFIQWQPDGASYSTFREMRATAQWTPTYSWAQWNGARSMRVDIQIPVEPLGRGYRMDVYDPFDYDYRGEHTYDAGASTDEQVSGGVLLGAGTLTTERRAIHTARGYLFVDSRQRLKATPGATITGVKFGRVIKRLDANNYIEGYVDDNGTNSRVRIDKVSAGVRTNLASANLAARITSGTPLWVRPTILGNVVTCEHFTAEPGPLTAPTTSATTTLASADATQFGAGVAGGYGRVWIPQHASASIDDEHASPYWSGSLTAPAVAQWGTPIPGDAPALADAIVTHSGGAAAPLWALLAWVRRASAGLAPAPFGIIEAESAASISGWAVTADATAGGGSALEDAAASSAKAYSATWAIDPSVLAADDFEREVAIELWARVLLSSTLVTPTLVASLIPEDGTSFGAARYTDEWGQAGKVLTVPSSGTAIWRMTRLGTLRALVDPQRPRKWLLKVTATLGAGSSGNFGLDRLLANPARQRALGPTGVAGDSTYPAFLGSTSQTSKTVKTDLSALTAIPPKWGHPDHGLGGQLLELPPGNVDMLCKLSTLVPDDPTASASSEQLAHTVGLGLSVTPRYYLVRSS